MNIRELTEEELNRIGEVYSVDVMYKNDTKALPFGLPFLKCQVDRVRAIRKTFLESLSEYVEPVSYEQLKYPDHMRTHQNAGRISLGYIGGKPMYVLTPLGHRLHITYKTIKEILGE